MKKAIFVIICVALLSAIFICSCDTKITTDQYIKNIELKYGSDYLITEENFKSKPDSEEYVFTKLEFSTGYIILVSNKEKTECSVYDLNIPNP